MKALLSEAGEKTKGREWTVYPRPQMVREGWQCLNGEWDFGTDPEKMNETILVPFCPESLLSGIGRTFPEGTKFCYKRRFRLGLPAAGRRILLHFGAVDQVCEVFVNGGKAGSHAGGYLPFTFDVTELVKAGEENELYVEARDELDHSLPWGKQKRDRGGMWYTPVSGIWQTVWLESVPERYVRSLLIRTDEKGAEIRAEGVTDGVIELQEAGEEAPRIFVLKNGCARIEPERPHLWSPEDPYLYHFTLKAGEDEVSSYFALRSFSAGTVTGIPRLLLNGEPYFFHGLLDQGYFSDGIYTAPSPASYEEDIRKMKALGFNTLRKHIKIEPEQFYYDCDRLGMIVFQDMVNNGGYRYIRDTVLPTLHLQNRRDRRLTPDPETRRLFLESMEQTVSLLGNHPCVCLWTIFNEGWGQFCADDAYRRLKALDGSRFIDATSGWFHQKESDVDSLHIYFDKLHLGKEKKPQLLSEFGGLVWKDPTHSFNLDKTYGYRKFEDRESFVRELQRLYREDLLPLVPQGLCGAVYTQLSDVEDETNGFLSFDRAVIKLSPEELAPVARLLQQAIRGERETP